MTIPQAVGVPKGRPQAARYVREFVEEMKASGFVASSVAAIGLGSDDAIVAPPDKRVLPRALFVPVSTKRAHGPGGKDVRIWFTTSISAGFTRCAPNPASRARSRSCS